MEWYYTEGSKRVGPVSEADFQKLIHFILKLDGI
jgi:hypothetical protein